MQYLKENKKQSHAYAYMYIFIAKFSKYINSANKYIIKLVK